MKIIDYIILQSHNHGLLRNGIKSYLTEGYDLYGSPFGIKHSEWDEYCQAMVKYEESAEELAE